MSTQNWMSPLLTQHDADRAEFIGHSAEGRPLSVHYLGQAATPLRILIFAGQHGDEPLAMQAVSQLASLISAGGSAPAARQLDGKCQLALLPCLNPDGLARNTRTNAQGIDLNRDHQLLAGVETQALHHFVRRWQPHLILDVHTYPPRRKHLVRQNLVYCHDLFLDVMSNPAINHPLLTIAAERCLEPVLAQIRQAGYRCDRYTLIRQTGRVRHSTPDVVDARNGLALRYGAFTLLVEGRTPARKAKPATQAAAVAAIQTALLATVQWAGQNQAPLIAALPPPVAAATAAPAEARTVAVGVKYQRAAAPCTMLFREARTKTVRPVELSGRFTPTLRPTRRVTLPLAYAVPSSHPALLEILARHGFATAAPAEGATYRVETYQRTDNATGSTRLHTAVDERTLANFLLLPTAQPGGQALALFLEPAAKYGLARVRQLGLSLPIGGIYPVLRVDTKACA